MHVLFAESLGKHSQVMIVAEHLGQRVGTSLQLFEFHIKYRSNERQGVEQILGLFSPFVQHFISARACIGKSEPPGSIYFPRACDSRRGIRLVCRHGREFILAQTQLRQGCLPSLADEISASRLIIQ